MRTLQIQRDQKECTRFSSLEHKLIMRSIRLYVFKVTLSASLEDLQFENPFAKGLRQKFKEHHAEGVLQFATLLTLFMILEEQARKKEDVADTGFISS